MSRKRNVARQTNFRPALPRRAVLWFPDFSPAATKRIGHFRRQFDPLAGALSPHLSLVFPFYANLSVSQLESHLKRVSRGWPVLPVTFRGVERIAGEFAVLSVDLRREALVELHDRFYRGPLAQFLRTDIEYSPHLTLGRATPAVSIDSLIAEAELIFRESYAATLRTLAIVTLGEDGTINVEKTVALDLP